MEQIVKFGAKQKVTVGDANAIGELARASLTNVVGDALVPTAKYAGGDVTIAATFKVNVSTPVRLYRSGMVFSRNDDNDVSVDLFSSQPTAGFKRIVAITLTGSTTDDEVEERDFLVNATTRETQAQPTSTRNIRLASINTIAGAAAVDPVPPAIPVEHLAIAYVLIGPTAIESVTQDLDNRMVSLEEAEDRLGDVEDWKNQTQPVLDGLKSDIAKLSSASKGKSDRTMISYLLEQTARLNEAVGIGQDAAFSATDFFLTEDDSDTENVNYLAKVEEGLRFSNANEATFSPVLSNPSDSRFVVHSNGLLLPAYFDATLISISGKDSEVALSNAGSQNTEFRKRSVSRTRIRWGKSLEVCTNNIWWQTGRYDPVTHIFRRDGESWIVANPEEAQGEHSWLRLTEFWVDTYEQVYWDAITTTASYVGTVNAQTFLNPRAAWWTKIRLPFSRRDTAGDVRLLVALTRSDGSPDPQNVLCDVNVPFANIKLYPALTEVTIPPLFVEAGQRLAVILVTGGNHWLAMAGNNKYAQGTFFTSTDGAWFQGDVTRDAAIEIVAAQFSAPRIEVAFDPWNLDGGITDIDLSLEQIAPDIAESPILFQVRAGGTWYSISAESVGSGSHPLSGQPAALPAKMILQGTTDVMPGIYLNTSKVTLSRPRTTGKHISAVRTTPVAVDEVHLVAVLEGYVEANHDCVAKLLSGAGYATVTAASSSADQTLPDGSIKRTWTWTGLSSLTSFKREIDIDTSTALSVFHVAEATDIAYPA